MSKKTMTTTGLTHRRFGHLTVTGRDPERPGRWKATCDCGTTTSVRTDNLTGGFTRSCGCAQHRPTVSHGTMTYNSVHQRLRRVRGRAAEHPCVDCSGPAYDWSLSATPTHVTEGGRGYSTDLDDYEPRCRSCHRAQEKTLVSA